MVKLYKPTWVSHDGNPIYSCDVHPDGSRFATGGQGQDCGQVCIWSMAPVLRADEEKKESVPKLLCQLTNHLSCVNCVRWSNDGRYLASTGDDKTIMIWQIGRTITGAGSYGAAFGKTNVEQWRTVSCLKGHDGDILDLAWAPSDQYIASCSVDTTCIIWSTRRWHDRIAILKGHQGFVKGVSWDPVGKYIATQSDDKTIRIWRTHDWQQECVITDPFEDCGGTTHVLRLNWSPDGQYLVSAHAMNNGGPTAQIIERGNWKTDKDFVGHRKAVTVVRFFPTIMKRPGSDGQTEYFACLAIGSRDRSISVWLNDKQRPLCVVHDLFTSSVVDASWNPVSHQLIVCSSDGSLAVLEFSMKELGQPILPDERATFFHKMYGLAGQAGFGTDLSGMNNLLVENVDVLKAHERAKTNGIITASRLDVSQTQSNASMTSAQRLAKGPTDRQIETIMPNGRRRITPLYIPLDLEIPDFAQPTFSSSTLEKSKIVIEKRESNSLPPILSSAAAPINSSSPATNSDDAPRSLGPPAKLKETASVPPVQQAAPAATTAAAIPASTATAPATKSKAKRIKPTLVCSLAQEPTGSVATFEAPAQEEVEKPSQITYYQPQHITAKTSQGQGASISVNLFPALRLKQPCLLRIEQSLMVEVITDIPVPGGSTLSRVVCRATSGYNENSAAMQQEIWDAVLAGRLNGVAGTPSMICVCGEDQLLMLLCARTGRRLVVPLLLNAQAAQLTCCFEFCVVVTTDGKLTVYDATKLSSCGLKMALSESIRSLVLSNSGAPLRSVKVTKSGQPLVAFSNGRTYLFDAKLSSWCLISATSDMISQCSDHYTSLPIANDIQSRGPLEQIQSSMFKASVGRSKSSLLTNPSIQRSTTLAFIETEINAAKALDSESEYKYWLMTQVRYLTQEGMDLRLRHVLDDLIGSIDEDLCPGMKIRKRELLKELLPCVATNLKLQRIYVEYSHQLSLIESGGRGALPKVTSLRAQQLNRVSTKRKIPADFDDAIDAPAIRSSNAVRKVPLHKSLPSTMSRKDSLETRRRGRPPKTHISTTNGINGIVFGNGCAQKDGRRDAGEEDEIEDIEVDLDVTEDRITNRSDNSENGVTIDDNAEETPAVGDDDIVLGVLDKLLADVIRAEIEAEEEDEEDEEDDDDEEEIVL